MPRAGSDARLAACAHAYAHGHLYRWVQPGENRTSTVLSSPSKGNENKFFRAVQIHSKIKSMEISVYIPALCLISLPLPASPARVVLGYSWWTYMDIITQGP